MDEQTKRLYEGTLKDLDARCAESQRLIAGMQAKLRELHQAAQTIGRLLVDGSDGAEQLPLYPSVEPKRYASLSVRWAILCVLTEENRPLSAQEIADMLITGGIHTYATNFANNVSSVLSQMKAKPEPEVETADGKWTISEIGRRAWHHISAKQAARQSQKFRRASSKWTEAPGAVTPGDSNAKGGPNGPTLASK